MNGLDPKMSWYKIVSFIIIAQLFMLLYYVGYISSWSDHVKTATKPLFFFIKPDFNSHIDSYATVTTKQDGNPTLIAPSIASIAERHGNENSYLKPTNEPDQSLSDATATTKQDGKSTFIVPSKISNTNHEHQNIVRYNMLETPEPYTKKHKSKMTYSRVDHYIQRNSYLKSFGMSSVKNKKKVTLLLIVSSGPRRYDRRDMIRKTWWKQCQPTGNVIPECIFMTDYQTESDTYYNITKYETERYHDMHFQKLTGGVEFGIRFLYHMVYAVTHYNFDYFQRMDDDYFLCMEKFLREIPVPMEKHFHWGWVHDIPGITRPEESMILFSSDVIDKVLSQDPNKMLCHPFADQMIGTWSNEIEMKTLFRHDDRLHHDPPVRDWEYLEGMTNICQDYIGLHGAYPKQMNLLWNIKGEQRTTGNLKINTNIIYIIEPFQWENFVGIWKFEPKLCITNPTWDTSDHVIKNGSYSGRQR